jgi:hypothetical protein
MISGLLMLVGSIIGLFGSIYVVLRHFVANNDRKGGWPLLYTFILAPLFVWVGLSALGNTMESDLHPEVWSAATLPIFSIGLFCEWLLVTIRKRNGGK